MSHLRDALDDYLAAISTASNGGIPRLNPGRSDVQHQLGQWSKDPVEDLVDLWSWRDGEERPHAGMFAGGLFHDLDRVLGSLQSYRENLEEHRSISEAEGVSWSVDPADVVPILSVSHTHIFVDSGQSETRGHIFHFFAEEIRAPLDMFASLTEAVRAAQYCVEAGYWVPEDNARFMTSPLRAGGVTEEDMTSPPFRRKDPHA